MSRYSQRNRVFKEINKKENFCGVLEVPLARSLFNLLCLKHIICAITYMANILPRHLLHKSFHLSPSVGTVKKKDFFLIMIQAGGARFSGRYHHRRRCGNHRGHATVLRDPKSGCGAKRRHLSCCSSVPEIQRECRVEREQRNRDHSIWGQCGSWCSLGVIPWMIALCFFFFHLLCVDITLHKTCQKNAIN